MSVIELQPVQSFCYKLAGIEIFAEIILHRPGSPIVVFTSIIEGLIPHKQIFLLQDIHNWKTFSADYFGTVVNKALAYFSFNRRNTLKVANNVFSKVVNRMIKDFEDCNIEYLGFDNGTN